MSKPTNEVGVVYNDLAKERLARLESAVGCAATDSMVANFHSERIPLADGCKPEIRDIGGLAMVVAERADGTNLVLETKASGPRGGWPVIVHHGTGFSARGPLPDIGHLNRAGVRWIAISRPGYGNSPPYEGRIIADSATDTEAVANLYGLEQFSVVGRSTGGLHALACMALLPDRAVNAVLFSSIAPYQCMPHWSDDMSEVNQRDYGRARTDPAGLLRELMTVAELIKTDREAMLKHIEPDMSESDRAYIYGADPFMRRVIAKEHQYGLRNGALGWFDDILATKVLPLGYDPTTVTAPVHLMQGFHDNFTSMEHYEWLQQNVPGAEFTRCGYIGHMATLDLVPQGLLGLRREARGLSFSV